MAEFAAEYLKQYWAIVPKGRLPETLSEMMPALNLLVNAAELAVKADLIRSGNDSGGHSLPTLYGRVDCKHREAIERRFAEAPLNSDLRTLGSEPPTVESVLGVYERGFGWSPVYQDTRYYAEPTTRVKSEDAKGGHLVKDIPYPIFLPVVVQTIIDVYGLFSGAERLKRLGAEVGYRSRDPGNDQHGDWGLVPSSVGLVVLRVAQFVAKTERGELRDEFRQFKEARPPLYCTSWMYGGNVFCSIEPAGSTPRMVRPSSMAWSARSGMPADWACIHAISSFSRTFSKPPERSRNSSGGVRRWANCVARRVCSTRIGGVTQCITSIYGGQGPGLTHNKTEAG